MPVATPSAHSTAMYCVILVCDLEDYSLWCQTVDPSVIGAFTKRFLGSTDLLFGLLGGTFLKSTGDGVIAIWAQPRVESDDGAVGPLDAALASTHTQVANLLSVLLQFLTTLGWSFDWPTPRNLRCAVHVGVLHKLDFVQIDGSRRVDFMGEAINAACRLEKLGDGVRGAVHSEHAARLLASTGMPLVIEVPAIEGYDLKSAQWLAKRVYGWPTASLLERIQSSYDYTAEERASFLKKYHRTAARAAEESIYVVLKTIHAVARNHSHSDPRLFLPPWVLRLQSYAYQHLDAPNTQLNNEIGDGLSVACENAWCRFHKDHQDEVPTWPELRNQTLTWASTNADGALLDLIHILFGNNNSEGEDSTDRSG